MENDKDAKRSQAKNKLENLATVEHDDIILYEFSNILLHLDFDHSVY